MTRLRHAAVAVISAVLVCSACGGSGRAISPDAAKLLQSQVASARAAVAQGDPGRAALVLHGIESTVGNLRAQHLISDRRAAAVLAALGDTQDALQKWVSTSTTTTISTTTTTTPPNTSPRREHGHGGKHGDGGD